MAEEKGANIEMDTVRLPQKELSMTLRMHQIWDGPGQNQVVVSSGTRFAFGTISVNDWAVLNKQGNLVGNARGMHISCEGIWDIYFDLVFKHDMFKGSALKLLGTFAEHPEEGEWAIVGGTGQFTLAQGVIAYTASRQDQIGGRRTFELKLRVFYTPLREIDTVRLPHKELCMTLYVHQVWSGPKKNQEVVVVPPDKKSDFGRITANDWTVFDNGANLVGNAQGMHVGGHKTFGPMTWNIYFDLVFKDGRFKGSSLKLLGTYGPLSEGEWAIVGGTGQFTLAQGVIDYKIVQDYSAIKKKIMQDYGGGMCIMELEFRVFYTTLGEMDTMRLPQKELRTTLYVHQARSGPEKNQHVIVEPKDKSEFGKIAAVNWTVFDGMGSNKKLVGNAMGIHMGGCKTTDPMTWNIYFDLVFKDGRFKGSSLMLMGTYCPPGEGEWGIVGGTGEWAIVGGTGEFKLAQGVIAYKIVLDDGVVCITKLEFRVFYTTLKA